MQRLFISAMLLASALLAACASKTKIEDACADQMTQGGMNECQFRQWQATDAKMNDAYDMLMERVKTFYGDLSTSDAEPVVPAEDELLRRSQIAWIDYRDTHCAFVAGATEGGSVQPMIRAICLTELTEKRTRELNWQLACPEGDLACVAPKR